MGTDISYLSPVELLKRFYPELKNAKLRTIFDDGRRARLAAESKGLDTNIVPLFSRNATYQSTYKKGWLAVTVHDIEFMKRNNL
ncbi:hypothetical protein [Serratia fonticola]|uniref:hypothetical protein n=1 Tax=Serratia fonticola TaxID=47917 RepID=UPI0015C5CA1E|nr:hypothetical protein [Serratia fonticola]NYA16508.1 hypothetical protein [Serratia fonticola]NYA33669.1 hypothetical protein [Serratia fonticola]